MPDLPVTQGC